MSDREDGLKSTALDDLCRLARTAHYTLAHEKVFGLLGLLPQAISSKITIDYKRDETDLSSEFTAAVSIANENSGNLKGARATNEKNMNRAGLLISGFTSLAQQSG